MGSGKYLHRAIDKHGVDNFTKEVLHVFDNETEMNLKEKELVTEEFCLRKDTYNLCNGGHGGFGYINRMGLEANKKRGISVSKALKGRPQPYSGVRMKEHHKRGKIRYNTFLGRKHTDEAKKKMSVAKKGIVVGPKNSQYGTIWITNEIENKKIRGEIPEGWRRGRSFPRFRSSIDSS